MKKIISLICAVLLLFSFSAVAYADYESTSTPTKEHVQVDASLEVLTAIGKPEQFNDSKVEPINGRIFNVKFLIANKTKEVIFADKVLANFDLSVVDLETKEAVKLYTEAKDYGFDEDPEKIAINPNKDITFTYKIYAITDKAVSIRVIHEEKIYDFEKHTPNGILTFYLVEKTEEPTVTEIATETSTSTSVTETSTSTSIPAEETSVPTAPTESTKSHTATIIMDLPDSPNTDAPIEDEIPNTGSTKAIYAAAALAIAGAVALLIIKKKSDD